MMMSFLLSHGLYVLWWKVQKLRYFYMYRPQAQQRMGWRVLIMARYGIGITITPSSPNSPVVTFVSLYVLSIAKVNCRLLSMS